MAELGCQAQDKNRAAHDQFRTRLDEMLSWLENTNQQQLKWLSLKQELEDWLMNHISTIDVQYEMLIQISNSRFLINSLRFMHLVAEV